MTIGQRLRSLREQKKLSQGDIEARCGLARSYISRVEHGHTIPSIETLEKLARGLRVPLYQLFLPLEDEEPLKAVIPSDALTFERITRGSSPKETRFSTCLYRLVHRLNDGDRRLLLEMAQKMTKR